MKMMCAALEVSRSGYLAWRDRPAVTERDKAQGELTGKIEVIHAASRGTYGSPRVHATLVRDGVSVSEKTVARRMREVGLRGRVHRRFKVTTKSKDGDRFEPNLLNREFSQETPDSVWCTDIKAVWTDTGWVYLAAVIDLATRLIVGWSMERHMETSLVVAAFEDALQRRQPAPVLVHHSDRGSQFTSDDYRKLLEEHGVTVSMSRKGDCWDNAVMESFFGTYAQELVLHRRFRGLADARQGTFEYIELFYNTNRIHSSLGYRTPAEVDKALAQEESAS